MGEVSIAITILEGPESIAISSISAASGRFIIGKIDVLVAQFCLKGRVHLSTFT
jgi:hypothetical protein